MLLRILIYAGMIVSVILAAITLHLYDSLKEWTFKEACLKVAMGLLTAILVAATCAGLVFLVI